MSEVKTVADVKAMNVELAREHLAGLTAAELAELRGLEVAEGDGKTRKTLVAAIDAALEALGGPIVDAAGRETGAETSAAGAAEGGAETGAAGAAEGGAADVGAIEVAGAGDPVEGSAPFDALAPSLLDPDAVLEGAALELAQAAMAHMGVARLRQMHALIGEELKVRDGASGDDLAKALDAERQAIADAAASEAAAARQRDAAEKARLKAEQRAMEEAENLYSRAAAVHANRDVSAGPVAGGRVYFSEGERFILFGAVPLDPGELVPGGLGLVVNRKIAFPPEIASARVECAWLRVGDNWASCPIVGGLAIGGGLDAELPAGHLAFAIGSPPAL